MLRDLEELRSKRIALENPVPILEDGNVEAETAVATNGANELNMGMDDHEVAPKTTIREEMLADSPEKQTPNEPQTAADESLDVKPQVSADLKVPHDLSPPVSTNETSTDSKPIGLGINTEGAVSGSAPGTAELPNSSIDSLFDIPDNDNAGDSELNFDGMDFSMPESTENQDLSQTQHNEFDLSNFGNNSQDFDMADLSTNQNINQTELNTNTQAKQENDLFAMVDTSGGGDNMDLDLNLGMAGAEDSVFDDMFFGDADDTGIDGGGEMQHGVFDNRFFGLE